MYKILLEAELFDYDQALFKGEPAIVLHKTPSDRYLLTKNSQMVQAQDLEIGQHIAIEDFGQMQAAEVISKPGSWYMKQTGTVYKPGGPTGEYEPMAHHGSVNFRVRLLDSADVRNITRKPTARIPLLVKQSIKAAQFRRPGQKAKWKKSQIPPRKPIPGGGPESS